MYTRPRCIPSVTRPAPQRRNSACICMCCTWCSLHRLSWCPAPNLACVAHSSWYTAVPVIGAALLQRPHPLCHAMPNTAQHASTTQKLSQSQTGAFQDGTWWWWQVIDRYWPPHLFLFLLPMTLATRQRSCERWRLGPEQVRDTRAVIIQGHRGKHWHLGPDISTRHGPRARTMGPGIVTRRLGQVQTGNGRPLACGFF